MRLLRSAFVIARRDFAATVLSKAFIFFLLGPLFPLLLGGVFAGIGTRAATQTAQPVVAGVANPDDFARLSAARERLAGAARNASVVRLSQFPAELANDPRKLRSLIRGPVDAVLTDAFVEPRVLGAVGADGQTVRQLRLIINDARGAGIEAPQIAVTRTPGTVGTLTKERALTGQIGQMLLFFLTILLSGMVMSQLIEEKSNKIIEVVAAAVPIDALFIGKLFAMLAASVLGIFVWVGTGAVLIQMITHGGVQNLPAPALGWPAFLALGIVYFAMNYLLLGAVFLAIGAQASTVREVQTMSMPVTFIQVLIFGFAASAIGAFNSPEGLAAAVFPLSSPMVMLARAAELPGWWPHVAAIAWQVLWVALILKVGASMFRKTVLKSGPRTRWWKRRSVA
jgi:ABC-2 type transport system permease protein